jgi:cephalosporin hydroxylase
MKTLEEIWNLGVEFKVQQKKIEFMPFLELLQKENPQIIIEIGVCHGGASMCFGQLAKTVIGIDVPVTVADVAQHDIRKHCNFYFVTGNSHEALTVEKVKVIIEDKKADMLFIDGDHGASGAQQDFEMYSPFVKPGGLVAFHDIVDSAHHRSVGVTVADVWNKIKQDYEHWEFVDPAGIDCGIGVIRLKE